MNVRALKKRTSIEVNVLKKSRNNKIFRYLKRDFRLYLFIVIVFFVFVPLTILGGYINKNLAEALHKNIYQSSNETINEVRNTITIYNDDMKRNMSTISEIVAVKNMDKVKMQNVLIENVKGNPLFKGLYVANKNGDIVYNTSGLYRNVSYESYFMNAINKRPEISIMKISEINGKPMEYYYAVPITSGEQVVGALIADLDIKAISNIIEQADTDVNHNIFVINDTGMLLGHKNWNAVSEVYEYLGFKPVIEAMRGNKGQGVFTFKGEKYLSVYSPISDMNMSIVEQIPYNIAFSEVSYQNRLFIYVLSGAFISILILAFIVTKRISRPLLSLSNIMSTVSTGNLEVDFDEELTKREDQFGQLACRFNEMMKTIRNLSYYDSHTNLPNRRYFTDRLAAAIKNDKYDKSFAVMFLDIDNFKYINDTWGHPVGDRVLEEAAQRMKACIRKKDIVAKLGGDEFIFLIYAGDHSSIENVAEAIINCFKRKMNIDGQTLRVTASLGIAFYPKDGADDATLLRHTDIAMYKAKENGGNSFEIFSEGMDSQLIKQNKLRNDLYNALEYGELILNYQPLVDTATHKIIGMETLVRWRHSELGIVPPNIFIPMAEETGLIVPISEWILKTACSQNKQWQDNGLVPVKVSVNISAKHFLREDFIEMLENILDETKLEPKYLELEITEGIALKNADYSASLLKRLKDTGITVALDDFGTGYSSLSYLTKFAFNTIKIDKSFVSRISQGEKDDAIISSIISIGHGLNLKVTAEGVETAEQLEFLKKYNCDKIHGYIFSKPVPSEVFEELLRKKIL